MEETWIIELHGQSVERIKWPVSGIPDTYTDAFFSVDDGATWIAMDVSEGLDEVSILLAGPHAPTVPAEATQLADGRSWAFVKFQDSPETPIYSLGLIRIV